MAEFAEEREMKSIILTIAVTVAVFVTVI